MEGTRRGFGVAAAIPLDIIRDAAALAESLHYDSFWVNHPPHGDGLAALAAAASATHTIRLGVGVIPLTSRSPESIIQGVRDQQLPLDRLLLGIGSGSAKGGLALVRAGIQALRVLPVEIVIAALGPKMCHLAGEAADGVLFNWLTPQFARTSAEWVRVGAQSAGRRPPTLYAYVRTALGPAAAARLATEGARYQSVPAYGSHFARAQVAPTTTGVTGDTPEQLRAGLAAWAGVVDEVIVRAITADDTRDQTLELVRAAGG
jgi:alkanesulfonate monooxygenase SsuD/methylene tetrahydromethanopterin reductase-like flavin-dependent oxidoreductase (luciferase family)